MRGAFFVIAVVNPTSLALLRPPGEWGSNGKGADIVVGDGQPLGVPLSSGGPYFGFMTTRMEYVRQMPGRIVGRTLDLAGRDGFTPDFTGSRAAHPARQGDLQHLYQPGPAGDGGHDLHVVDGACGPGADRCCFPTRAPGTWWAALTAVKGVRRAFAAPFFHEAVVQFDRPVGPILTALASQGILGGLDLAELYPELGYALLVCATETKTQSDINSYVTALGEAVQAVRAA